MPIYRIRLMEPGDIPACRQLHAEQNARDHTDYPFVSPFDESGRKNPNTVLALAVLRDNQVRQGDVVERSAELLLFGCDPRATAVLHQQIGGLFYLLRSRGYTGLHCLVPKRESWWRRWLYRLMSNNEIPRAITRSLESVGFRRDDHRLAHFYKDLAE